ncbi:MAG: hypothetical protein EOM08_11555, partial [Clostridia bacterium]|nr:hypothetical protein [Clostridia bacterium]
MHLSRQQANQHKSRFPPVHLLEILVWLAHLAWLPLLMLVQPRWSLELAWLALPLVIVTAIPYGPVAGFASGLSLAAAERLAAVFQMDTALRQIVRLLLADSSGHWIHLAVWPLAGLLAGFYATWFSRSSRRQARKAWELARANQQLKDKVSRYEERLSQALRSGDSPDGLDLDLHGSSHLGFLARFLYEALALRTHSISSQAAGQTPGTLPEALFD